MPMDPQFITQTQARTIGKPKVEARLTTSFPSHVAEDDSGSSTRTTDDNGTDISTGGNLGDFRTLGLPQLEIASQAGLAVFEAVIEHNTTIDNLEVGNRWGFAKLDASDGEDNTVFDPGNGEIQVDPGPGTSTSESFSYPTLTEPHYYAVAVDYAAGESRFYVDNDPLVEGAEDATIEVTPSVVRPAAVMKLAVGSDGGETITIKYLSATYVAPI